jgi:hypothetical protein
VKFGTEVVICITTLCENITSFSYRVKVKYRHLHVIVVKII